MSYRLTGGRRVSSYPLFILSILLTALVVSCGEGGSGDGGAGSAGGTGAGLGSIGSGSSGISIGASALIANATLNLTPQYVLSSTDLAALQDAGLLADDEAAILIQLAH